MISLFDDGGFAPCPDNFNMAAHVLGRARIFSDKIALEVLEPHGCETWTYAGLEAAVLGTATGLARRGLVPGDIVLMRLGNTVDFPIAYLGALAAGMVPVPTSSALTDIETQRITDTLDPAVILRDEAIACPDDARILPVGALREMRALAPAPYHRGDPNRLGYIIYTSGTSGRPRAVMHAHRAIWARQMMFEGWYGLREDDRVLHAGAFNWTYTLGTGLMDPWTMGATALIPAAGTAPDILAAFLHEHKASIFAAAPGVYRQILKHREKIDPAWLRHGLSAGEKLPQSVRQDWEDVTGTPIFEAYGMSECSTFLSASPARPAAGGALGYPQPGRRIAILGEEGPVPRGTEGTIAVHKSDPGLMLGYYDAAGETARKYHGDWFSTGDQGVMDDSDQITYLGRTDDMMNAGGFRVSPIEVEQAFAGYDGMMAIGVTEVEIKRDVRVIAAFYTAAAPLDDAALRSFAEGRLARYKQPRLFIHLPALPSGANGKLLRRMLARDFEAKNHG